MRKGIYRSIKHAMILAFALSFGQKLAAQTVPGSGFDAIDYAITITPDIPNKSLSGESVITVEVTDKAQSEFAFSAFDLPIERATVNGQKARIQCDKTALMIVSPKPIKKGATARISISYQGRPKQGVIFGADYAYSDYFACSWTPCLQDKPGDKAKVAISIIAKAGQDTQSIGTVNVLRPQGSSLVQYNWTSATPYSNYLFSFAVGRYNRVALSPRLDVANLTQQTPDQVRALFGTTPDMVAFFEERSGVPMPVGHYTQLLTPGDDAQEAATYSTMGQNQITPILKDPTDDWVIAHELAHLWWGNGVTCESWDQFWLNEGITSFMVAAWKEHRHGRAAYDAEMDHARDRVKRAVDRGYDKPLTFAGPYPSLGTRRAIQYSKGALFMDALRRELGDGPFWQALRTYTRQYMGKTVNSRDFQRAFEVSSGRDLSALFKAWVYTA
jgi:aminopeptidase N